MKFILCRESCIRYQKFIKTFEMLYLDNFPDENEREDFNIIINNIENNSDNSDKNVMTFAVVITGGTFSRDIAGGMFVELYKNSRTLTIPYIVVNPNYRNKKIATQLIHAGIRKLRRHIRKRWKIRTCQFFLEVNHPLKVQIDNFDPYVRLYIYKKLGFRHMPIPHIQPAFPGKKEVHHLILLTIACFNAHGNRINADELLAFYADYFRSFGVSGAEHERMIRKMSRLIRPVRRTDGTILAKEIPHEYLGLQQP